MLRCHSTKCNLQQQQGPEKQLAPPTFPVSPAKYLVILQVHVLFKPVKCRRGLLKQDKIQERYSYYAFNI